MPGELSRYSKARLELIMNTVELPFLYQTRTILRQSSWNSTVRSVRPRHPSRRCLSVAPNSLAEEHSESFLSQKAKAVAEATRRKSKPNSITRTEKEVFDGIFKDIKESAGRTTTPKRTAIETDPDAILQLFVPESGQSQDLNSWTGLAETTPNTTGNLHTSKTQLEEHIKRYPSALRHAAHRAAPPHPPPPDWPEHMPSKAFQLSKGDRSPTLAFSAIPKDPRHGVYRPLDAPLEPSAMSMSSDGPQLRNFDAIKQDELAQGNFRGKTADYVKKELRNISTELESYVSNSAHSGAFSMWEICQSRIFPLIKLLEKEAKPKAASHNSSTEDATATGLQTTSTAESSTADKPRQKPLKKINPQSSPPLPSVKTKVATPALPPGVSPLSTVTILYPALTLLALRLFTTHHPTTPFPVSMYNHIITSSPQSRILGLNVHFYNTLLQHIWDIYSDLKWIAALLSEMQGSGVEFDGTTYTTIQGIEAERWTQMNTGEGTRGKEWWLRPEQMRRFPTLMEWKQVVAMRLQEQGMGHLLAEREYDSESWVPEKGTQSAIAERPKVWL